MTASPQKLRVLDLFSGIGGFSLGLEWAGGFEPVAFCETKPHARAVLAKHWPSVPCHDDVTTYDFKEGEADVITAGFPCQDISFAGAGAGLAGARSGLYREVIRAIRVVRPLRAVLENVAALLGRGLGTILGDLASIGYDAEWHCIPASAVGAPHRRDRIWIVADAGGEQHESSRPPLSGALASELSKANLAHSEYGGLSERRRVADIEQGVFLARGIRCDDPSCGEHQEEEILANASGERCTEARKLRLGKSAQRASRHGQEMADADFIDAQRFVVGIADAQERQEPGRGPIGPCGNGLGWWAIEPRLGRVAHGVPNRVDRLEELGNAVVPFIPQIIGEAILQQIGGAR